MTRTKTSSGKYRGACRQAQSRMRDLANSFACASDPGTVARIDAAVSKCLSELYSAQGSHAELWTDGSYNEKAGAAGIGVMVTAPGMAPVTFGKGVRAKDSQEAELYAIAIGLSFLLDTFPGLKSVRIRYDCAGAASSAASIDAYADRGAPYTNFRKALKRCRKSGTDVLFQHVKAHAGEQHNETCDLLARYYAKARLDPEQMDRIRPYLRRK